MDVHFPDANTGYIVSQYNVSAGLRYGQVLKTTDAGETWQITADGDFGRLTSVYFTDENTGYMVCGYGKIYKTTDGGFLWDTLPNSYDSFLNEIVFVNQNTGFIAGENNNGIILKTSDAGNIWSTVYQNTRPVRGIHFVDENAGFAILHDAFLKTFNGGVDWVETPLNNIEGSLLDVFFVNQNVGYICGSIGAFFKTTDGGETWTDLSSQFTCALTNMFFVDEFTGYMSGDGGNFFQTNNGGISWTNLGPTDMTMSSLWFTDELTGISVGGDGNIFKTTDGGQVFSESHIFSESFFSLFPNPTNSSVTIRTNDNSSGLPVNISILNCNGMLVKTEKQKVLPHQIDINNLATGIYFLRIETAKSVEIRKLVKM